MQLTPSQSKALSQERHLAVVANAGSGKTNVLVKRYVDILEKRPELETRNIAAITFTENAAAELAARISKEVNERLANSTDKPRRKRLLAIRDSLSSAFIGTIHSFCSRILRAYPVEANVDSSFQMLIGADQRLLVEETIDRVFYSELEEAYTNDPDGGMLGLFRTLGRKEVKALILKMLSNRERVDLLAEGLAAFDDSAIVRKWREVIEREIQIPFETSTVGVFHELLKFKGKGTAAGTAEECYTAYLASSGFFGRTDAYKQLVKVCFTKEGLVGARPFRRDDLPASVCEAASDFWKQHYANKELLNAIPTSETEFVEEHQAYLQLQRTLFALYSQVHKEYASVKTLHGLLDFEDLIAKAKRLLDDPRVREELSLQFAYLMIDEYQDTDRSQFQIAAKLSNNFRDETNIAIVGDPKQSIYGFRNAEAGIFDEARHAIGGQTLSTVAEEESLELQLNPVEELGHLAMRESFRMAVSPLAFINLIFQNLFEGSEDFQYHDLVAARESDMTGSVTWIVADDPKLEQKGEQITEEGDPEEFEAIGSESEVNALASRIHSMVEGIEGRYSVHDKGVTRDARFSDIAILLRSRTKLQLLEKALRTKNIPYQVSKGSGFYSQQEITDIVCYLEFLITPSNDIALAAILRSPFFALSDVDLFQIAHHARTNMQEARPTFWQKLQDYASKHSKPHLKRAVGQISENLVLAGRTPSAYLVEKIYSETAVFATIGSFYNGPQKSANLEKLLGLARDSDRSGFSSLYDFTERLRYLIDQEEEESQATPDATIDAVRIMTVHSAKGLEFPIVCVPFLQKKFNLETARTIDKDLGILMNTGADEENLAIVELIKSRAKLTTIEEEKRILYVALTRAQDHLLLSSTSQSKSNKSWLSWMANVFPEVREGSESISRACSIERYDANTQTTSIEAHPLRIAIVSQMEADSLNSEQKLDSLPPITKEYLYALPVLHPRGRFSATQFLTHRECPTKYHLLYRLGLPEEPKLAPDLEADEYSERVRGALVGQIVHNLLEKIERIAPSGTLDMDRFAKECERVLHGLNITTDTEQVKYSKTALTHVRNVIASPIAEELFARADRKTEYPVQAKVDSGDILFGIIDRLYQASDGVWTVLDYKTDSTTSEKRRLKKSERYLFQIRFYAALVAKQLQVERVRGILLYTAQGRIEQHEFLAEDLKTIDKDCTSIIANIRKDDAVRSLEELDRNLSHCPDCSFYNKDEKQCIVLSAERSKSQRHTSEIPELV